MTDHSVPGHRHSQFLDGCWRLTWRRDGDCHVYPVGDLMSHILKPDAQCPCVPTPETLDNETTMWTHHSLDGRERAQGG